MRKRRGAGHLRVIGPIVGIAAAAAAAAAAPAPAASAVSQASAQTTATRPEIDAIFAPWDRPGSPGCALGVIEAGELTYERAYGSANLDWDLPISTQTVFYVGSVSKQFTAAAVALLAQDGRISLDDDIRRYFPEMPVYERPITVRHLVHHTSGLRDIYTLMALAGLRLEDVFSDAEAIGLIAGQRQTNFPPGDEYLYSNSGYFLLAQLVGRVTGTSLREFAAAEIFAPLGMADTHFHDRPDHVVARRATSYERDDGEFRVAYLGNFDKVGAGGLYSTVQDLLLWDRNFYTGDVGGQEFLDLIHTPGVLTSGDAITYAFGLTVDEYRGLPTVAHGGSMMGFKAAFLQFPEQRFSVVATCNLGEIEPMGLVRRVADVYLDDVLEPAESSAAPTGGIGGRPDAGAASLSEEALAVYAGDYVSDELGVAYRLFVDAGALRVELRNTPVMELRPLGNDEFRGRWLFRFERDDGDLITSFTVNAGRVTDIRFARR